MANYVDVPEGFEIMNQPQTSQFSDVPEGFQVVQQPPKPEMSRMEAAFITATNPLNFGDEIKAGLSAMTAKIFGGQATKDIDIGDLYREARDIERSKLAKAKETYPIQSGAIGFASDIPFEAAALGNKLAGRFALPYVGAGANAIGKIAGSATKLAAQGGTLAALGGAGASEAETLGGVAEDALTSGAIGAVAAPVVGAALPMIGKGASAVKGMFGRQPEQVVKEAISPEQAARGLEKLKASPEGQPTTGLDIDLPEFQALAKTAVSRYPQAKMIAADFAAGRKEEAVKRIDDILSKDISPIDSYFGDFAEKQKLQKIRGKENYDLANAYIPENAKLTPSNTDPFGGYVFDDKSLNDLIKTRSDFTIRAAKEASDLVQLEQGIKIDPNDLLTPSTKNVDMIKRGLDSLIDKETDALGKTSPKGRALEIYKGQLTERMDKLNPAYEKARNIYAGDFAVQKAQELGRKFDKMQPEEISIKMKGWGQSEKDAFRVGQRSRLQEMVDKSKNPADKLFGNENIKKHLKVSFGDPKKYNDFSKRLSEEMSYDKTIKNLGLNRYEVEGSSKGMINMIARILAGSKTGMVFEGVRAAETALIKNYKGLNEKNAKEIIRALSNKESSIKLLEDIVKKSDQKEIVKKAISDIYPIILGANIGVSSDFVSDAEAADPNSRDLEEVKKRYQEAEPITKYVPDEQELKRIIR